MDDLEYIRQLEEEIREFELSEDFYPGDGWYQGKLGKLQEVKDRYYNELDILIN